MILQIRMHHSSADTYLSNEKIDSRRNLSCYKHRTSAKRCPQKQQQNRATLYSIVHGTRSLPTSFGKTVEKVDE